MEGSKDLLRTYSDWRQEHFLGNMDWELPDESTLNSLTGSYDRMSEETEDLNSSTVENTKASNEMASAARAMTEIPALIQAAVLSGMSQVTFVLDGQAITNYVNEQMGEEINAVRR